MPQVFDAQVGVPTGCQSSIVSDDHRGERERLGDKHAVHDTIRLPLSASATAHVEHGHTGRTLPRPTAYVPTVRPRPEVDIGNNFFEVRGIRIEFGKCLGSIAGDNDIKTRVI
jgi:hypothetical protein